MVWWWLHMKGRLLTNILNKERLRDIRSNLACFVHIWNISNISVKFNFSFISKFRFDCCHRKIDLFSETRWLILQNWPSLFSIPKMQLSDFQQNNSSQSIWTKYIVLQKYSCFINQILVGNSCILIN